MWKVISPVDGWPKMTQRYIDESMEKFGKEAVRTITVGGQTYVRMTTFAELEKQFVEPGKVLMIPGYEQTGGCHNGQQVYMNFINVREVFPYREGDFYASNGLDFENIQFDGNTLSVKMDVREEARCRIEFIGTKKDYDPSSQLIEVEKGSRNPARKIDVFFDSIGVVLDVIEGTAYRQVYLGQWYDAENITRDFGIQRVPSIWLIGPDGIA